MAVINNQQMYVIKRNLDAVGLNCTFYRKGLNEFGEPSLEYETILETKGIFHSSNGFLNIVVEDAGQVQTQKKSLLLILYSDLLKVGDIVTINNNEYKITGLNDLGIEHKLLDISLDGDIDD